MRNGQRAHFIYFLAENPTEASLLDALTLFHKEKLLSNPHSHLQIHKNHPESHQVKPDHDFRSPLPNDSKRCSSDARVFSPLVIFSIETRCLFSVETRCLLKAGAAGRANYILLCFLLDVIHRLGRPALRMPGSVGDTVVARGAEGRVRVLCEYE